MMMAAQPPSGGGGQAPSGAQGQPGGQSQQQPGMSPQPGSPGYGETNTSQTAAPPKVNDNKFAKKAAEGGMEEVALGNLAAKKGSTPEVRQFGQKLVDDHTKANDELKKIAAQQNIDLPSSLSAKQQKKIDKFAKLSGAKFDKAFTKHEVKDHQKDIQEFKQEAQYGTNPAVKQFASNALPVLQQHLNDAKNLKSAGGMKAEGGQ